MIIEARHVTRRFGSFAALDDVCLTIPSGALVALLGPSGSGKTTLLRIIAGLERLDGGAIYFDGQDATALSPAERQVGFVFQHYALFRHMSVAENVAFGLRVRPARTRPSESAIRARVHDLLGLMQLGGLGSRRPAQLSGGQRQRVALARALAIEPRVLLLDEPFGALDARVREDLRRWLVRLHDELHVTSVFVTHDQEEALEIADHVAVMSGGRVEQVGTPAEVYDRPANPFVYEFLGGVNRIAGRLQRGWLNLGGARLAAAEHADVDDAPAVGYVRAHDVRLAWQSDGASSVPVTVRRIHVVGPKVRIELALDGDHQSIEAELSREQHRDLGAATGDRLFAVPHGLRVFVDEDGRSVPPRVNVSASRSAVSYSV